MYSCCTPGLKHHLTEDPAYYTRWKQWRFQSAPDYLEKQGAQEVRHNKHIHMLCSKNTQSFSGEKEREKRSGMLLMMEFRDSQRVSPHIPGPSRHPRRRSSTHKREYVSSAVRPYWLCRLYMIQAEATTTWMLFSVSAANATGLLFKAISPIAFQGAYLIYGIVCGCLLTSPTGHMLAYAETSKMHQHPSCG